jgi:hypothetical protein
MLSTMATMAFMMGATPVPTDAGIETPEPKQPPERAEPLLSYGNGRMKYEFETKWGIAEIWADNPKAAQKKLRTLEGINSTLKPKV